MEPELCKRAAGSICWGNRAEKEHVEGADFGGGDGLPACVEMQTWIWGADIQT